MRSEQQPSTVHRPPSTIRQQGLRVLIAAEGSGGHLIPAIEVARELVAAGDSVTLLYAQRKQAASLLRTLVENAQQVGVAVHPIAVASSSRWVVRWMRRAWQSVWLWGVAQRHLKAVQPHVVVGFGGWFSMPVVLAARSHRIPVLIHEQNVRLGRANRWLLRWHAVNQLARSFPAFSVKPSRSRPHAPRAHRRNISSILTGLPTRQHIGTAVREEAARRWGLDPHAPTVLVLGGSQGSAAMNRLICRMLDDFTDEEEASWQFVHLVGASHAEQIEYAYAKAQLRHQVLAHLAEMERAYAVADVVVTRAGASTIAELAQCGKPAVLIPYPYAGAHQRANAKLVESIGGGIWLEERTVTPHHLLSILRVLLGNARVREAMGSRIQAIACPDATNRLVEAIRRVAINFASRNLLNNTIPHPQIGDGVGVALVPRERRGHQDEVGPELPFRLSPAQAVHFMGIGGIGMSGLARLLRDRGVTVEGCDVAASPAQQHLRQHGIEVAIGHHPEHLTSDVGVVVFSSAVSSQEPELLAARARGIRTVSRGELLAEVASTQQLVAVAGAHGKTTTSGMAAQLLLQAGWDPTAVVGGYMRALGSNARSGRGRYLVAETDESDGSFLLVHPAIAMVTNIDHEHLNYYQNFDNLIGAFRQFVGQLGPQGVLIRCEDDPIVRAELSHAQQISYGLHQPADVRAASIRPCGWGSEFAASYHGQSLGTFRLKIPGRHNVLNALSVISLAIVLEIPLECVREALWAFQGTSRRFELFELPNDVWFIEDYAHHPAEIRATLTADPFHERHRVVVFQPHRFSRTKLLERDFTECFERADGLIVTDIYSAFEAPIPGVSGERVADLIKAHGHPCVRYVPRTELKDFLPHFIQPKDTVFFLGAGDIGALCHDLASQLRATSRTTG